MAFPSSLTAIMQTMTIPGKWNWGGHPGQNTDSDARYFVGGTVLNRPGLAAIGNTIVGGFGGHCDNFNYTGMLVAVSKTPGVGVTNIQAMEASPGKCRNPQSHSATSIRDNG